ncbi:PTS sugar transporter subunit IIA [Pseudactinotalea suaedae]|uniref:PTS sugar transporter subunit IIA n=1 Tax=Pseudactinotalea suaedae TaxID=1524924 RepID=UPI0012E1FD92|nr:PTS glucose transporter subunit IIA [Pseudactinotalea suaedae]
MPEKNVDVLAPSSGRVIPLAEVPDPVFAAAMVGPGAAIAPDLGVAPVVEAFAPVSGVVAAMHPHAFVIAGPGGGERGILVHLGIDTVQLKGAGFELLVAQGDEVVAGQPLVRWSPDDVVVRGMSSFVAVIALAADPDQLTVTDTERVDPGDLLFTWLH